MQISLTRVVTNTSKHSHISSVLRQLHWLPIEHWCVFKPVSLIIPTNWWPGALYPFWCLGIFLKPPVPDSVLLPVSQSIPSLHKSTRVVWLWCTKHWKEFTTFNQLHLSHHLDANWMHTYLKRLMVHKHSINPGDISLWCWHWLVPGLD